MSAGRHWRLTFGSSEVLWNSLAMLKDKLTCNPFCISILNRNFDKLGSQASQELSHSTYVSVKFINFCVIRRGSNEKLIKCLSLSWWWSQKREVEGLKKERPSKALEIKRTEMKCWENGDCK